MKSDPAVESKAREKALERRVAEIAHKQYLNGCHCAESRRYLDQLKTALEDRAALMGLVRAIANHYGIEERRNEFGFWAEDKNSGVDLTQRQYELFREALSAPRTDNLEQKDQRKETEEPR